MGTSLLCSQVRSSLNGSSRTSGGLEPVLTSADGIIKEVAKLENDGFVAVEMKRIQDRVQSGDVLRLHGAMILKLSHPDSDVHKFMRIDMGCDGLAYQLCDQESELITYADANIKKLGAAWTGGAACTAVLTMAAMAAPAPGPREAVAAVAVWSMLPATLVTGAAVSAEVHHNYFNSWKAVMDPTRSLKNVQEFILKNGEREYSLSDWNCNHFADRLFQSLLTISGDCFVPGTGFEDASGNLIRVENAIVGSMVRTRDEGCLATVAVHTRIRSKMQKLVELTTAQGSLKVSASHPVVTRLHSDAKWDVKPAERLREGDRVMIGRREVSLAKTPRTWKERTELFTIGFTPHVPVPTFQLPMFGILTEGVSQPAQVEPDGVPMLMRLFAEVGEPELREAMEFDSRTVWTD